MFNDVSFYTKNSNITDAVCKLPFNYIVGSVLPLAGRSASVALNAIVSFSVDYVAAVSNSIKSVISQQDMVDNSSSVLDQVATIIYTQMRRSNSGSTNDIEYCDPIISNLLASIDILVNAVSMRRTFKIANSFSWKNRLIPRYIFQDHLGLDYDDFIYNQAAYRAKFNTLVALARTIKTLQGFPFINAMIAEYENIFKDSDTDTGRESYIIPVKYFHHIYDPVGTVDNKGGCVRLLKYGDLAPSIGANYKNKILVTKAISPSALRKFSVDLNILETQINKLINDGDFNLLQADIEKAFGEQSGYIVIDAVPSEPETIAPTYSGEFNTMFHNGIFYPLPSLSKAANEKVLNASYLSFDNAYVNTIGQWHREDLGEIKMFNLVQLGYTSATSLSPKFQTSNWTPLDTDMDVPDVNEVILMTRYKTILEVGDVSSFDSEYAYPSAPSGQENIVYIPKVASNFICFGGNISYVTYDNSKAFNSKVYHNWSNAVTSKGLNTLSLHEYLFQLKRRPIFAFTANDGSTVFFNDLNNLRFISDSELQAIHHACFLSLWDLPSKTNI